MIPFQHLSLEVTDLSQQGAEKDGLRDSAIATIAALRTSLEPATTERPGGIPTLSAVFSVLSDLDDRHPGAVSPLQSTQREDIEDYFRRIGVFPSSSVYQFLERSNGVRIGAFTLMGIPTRSGDRRIHHVNGVYPRLFHARFLTIAKERSWVHFALDLQRPEPPVLCFNPLDHFMEPPEIVASSFTKFLMMIAEEVEFRLTHGRVVRWPIMKEFMDRRDPGLENLGYRVPWRTS